MNDRAHVLDQVVALLQARAEGYKVPEVEVAYKTYAPSKYAEGYLAGLRNAASTVALLAEAQRRVPDRESDSSGENGDLWQREAFSATVRLAEESNLPESGKYGTGLDHLRSMEQTVQGLHGSKLGRWLGWAQGVVVSTCAGTSLETMRELNIAAQRGELSVTIARKQADLDALPDRAHIRDRTGAYWDKQPDGKWWIPAGAVSRPSSYEVSRPSSYLVQYLPADVLWTP